MNGLTAGPPRAPLRGLNKDDKRALEQVVRRLRTTLDAILDEDKDLEHDRAAD
mgnify:CR=1 FL=1